MAAATKSFSAFLYLLLALLLSLSISVYLSISLFLCRLFWILLFIRNTRFPGSQRLFFFPLRSMLPSSSQNPSISSFRGSRENKKKGQRRERKKKKEIHTDSSRNCNKHVNARGLPRALLFVYTGVTHVKIYSPIFAILDRDHPPQYFRGCNFSRAEILFKASGRGERATVIFVLPHF